MGLFFGKKKADPSQPNRDWPWTISEGGATRQDFTLQTIESDVILLYPDNNSFIILEQRDPKDSKKYWYIQSAIAIAGPNKDRYIVGVGYPGPDGPMLFERYEETPEAAFSWFRAAFEGGKVDLSQFEDQHW